MRLFKKFLLAAGLVGLVGSLGFASDVKADTYSAVIQGEVVDNEVSWYYVSDDVDSETIPAKVDVYVGKQLVGTRKVPAEFEPNDPDDLDEDYIDTFSLDDMIAANEDLTSSLKGTVSISFSNTVDGDTYEGEGEIEGKFVPWYKVTATSGNTSLGTAKIKPLDEETSLAIKENASYLVKSKETVTLTASTENFSKWTGIEDTDGEPSKATTKVTVTGEFDAVANFTSGGGGGGDTPDPGKPKNSLTATVYDTNGSTVLKTLTVKDTDTSLTINRGQYIGFTSGAVADTSDYSTYLEASGTKYKAIRANTSGLKFHAKATDTTTASATLTVFIDEVAFKETKISIAGETYMTTGYEIELYTKIDTEGDLYKDDVVWEVTDGKGSFSSSKTKYDKDNKDNKVKLKFTGDDPKSGETAKIKIKAYIPKAKDGTDPAEATAEITVYPKNTLTFSTTDRTLSYKAPAKVNTGTTDGQESDNKDNTKTAISDIKGVKLQVFSGDSSLGTTSTAKEKGTSATIDASTVESILNNLVSKLSGDTVSLKFRAFPCDSDAKYNKNVYADATTTAYRVEITYTKADGTTATEVLYGFEGQEIDITKIAALKNATIEEDGKQVTKFKVSSSTSNNKKTAVLGASKTAADGTGLDKVPKTGQSNAFVYVMVAIVACAVCGGLYVYNKKTKNV